MIKEKINKERKEMKKYKTLCVISLVATMGIGLFGCSSNMTAPEEPKETEKQETKKKIPTEVMSAEETLQLPTETEIPLEDLEKMPDEATLEENNLMTTYVSHWIFYNEDDEIADEMDSLIGYIDEEFDEYGFREKIGADGMPQSTQVTGIVIKPISTIHYNDDGTFTKSFKDSWDGEEFEVQGGNIVSEKLINELKN